MSTSRPKFFQTSQKQEAITGGNECRLPRDRFTRPNLSISNANCIFLFTMINFYLPTIKIALQQCLCIAFRVGAQKISWVTIISFSVHRSLVRLRGYHQQTKGTALRTSLPQNIVDLFIANIPPCSSKMNLAYLPGYRVILSNRFRRKPLFAIYDEVVKSQKALTY